MVGFGLVMSHGRSAQRLKSLFSNMTFTGSTEDVPFYKAALSVLRGRVADSHSSYPGFRGETWAYGFVGEHAGVNPLLAGRFGRATLAFIRLKAG